MRIRDYLGPDAEKETELKAVAIFPRVEAVCQSRPSEKLSPFDRAMIERSARGTRTGAKENKCYPVSASVCLSHTCAHNCSGCPHGAGRKNENAFLDASSFEELLARLHSLKVKFIDLGGGGEPTTHPEFHRFAQMCVREDFEMSLASNGASLDSAAAGLLAEGFSFLIVNLDASGDEVYNQVHHPPDTGEFQQVLANIERVVSERERRESKLTVGAQIRLCQANMNFMEQMTYLARDLGTDYIQFRINQWALDGLLPEQIEQVDNLIPELRQAFGPFPIYGEIKNRKPGSGCPVSAAQLIVDYKGDAYPCPHFARLPQVASFGNVFTLPPEELWFGPQRQAAVRRLRECDCPVEYCRWRAYHDLFSGSPSESRPAQR